VRRCLAAWIGVAVIAVGGARQLGAQQLLTRALPTGPHAVGFKILHEYDSGRSYFPGRDYFGARTRFPLGRPMQVALWYPTESATGGRRLQFGEYVGWEASEEDFARRSADDRQQAVTTYLRNFAGEARTRLAALFQEQLDVLLDAPLAGGDLPIILYAPPLSTSYHDNSVLCAFLASRGYLVLATSAKGEYTRLQAATVRDIGVQMEDLGFLLQVARRFSHSDRVGTIGFSRGGMANVLFAMKNHDVTATVSLDGSLFSIGWLKDVAASPYYDPTALQSDLLMITKNLARPTLNPATFYEGATQARRSLIRFDHDVHGWFSSSVLLEAMLEMPSDSARVSAAAFYSEMAQYVGEFFDQRLGGRGEFREHATKRFAHSFLSDSAVGRTLAPSSIRFWIAEKGVSYVERVVADIMRHDSTYLRQLDWRDLSASADEALHDGDLAGAARILLLADRVVPKWYVVNAKLGAAYRAQGMPDKARNHFARALEDNPRDTVSRRALTELGVSAPDYHATMVPRAAWAGYVGRYDWPDGTNYEQIFLKDGRLFIHSNRWDKPLPVWPYQPGLFLPESDDPKANMQILFTRDATGRVTALQTRGMNSGRIGDPHMKRP
jgi:dienelactone hydrolase